MRALKHESESDGEDPTQVQTKKQKRHDLSKYVTKYAPTNTMPTIEKEEKRGVVGIANLGNTCYMNSVIQAIRHIPEWIQLNISGKINEHINASKPDCAKILHAFVDMQKSLWAGSSPSHVYPRGFYEALESVVKDTLYDQFIQRTPQDAHEFLVWLLDQFYMASQFKADFSVYNTPENYPVVRQAVDAWKQAFENQYSPLTDLFFGLYRIQIVCDRCASVFNRWETFNTWKVTPVENGSLYDAITAELQDTTIESYDCEHCKASPKERPNAVKKIRVWKLPKVLIITLKRFDYMGRKMHNVVSLENSNTYHFTEYFDADSYEKSKTIPYHITSTVDHFGSTMGGHYSAQCFSPIYKSWYRYDDEIAFKLDAPYVGPQNYLFVLRQGTYESQMPQGISPQPLGQGISPQPLGQGISPQPKEA